MEDIFIYLVASIVQMMVFFIYIREMLGLKRNILWFVSCWVIVSVVDELIVGLVETNNTSRNAILYLLYLEITAFIVCKGSWKKKLFTVLAFDVFIISLELVVVNVITLFKGEDINVIVSSKEMSNIILIVTQMLASIILLFVIYIWKRQKDYNVSTVQWLGILLVSLGCFIAICILGAKALNENEISKGYIAVYVILVFINFISYYYYIILAQKNKMEFQTKIQMKQITMYEQWYEEIKNVRQESKSFVHDMNNHFGVMKKICEEGENNPDKSISKIKDYLDSLGMEYKGLMANVESGNMALDAVVGIKKSYAMSKGINLETEIYIPKDMNCDSMDMVIILGNLLDNAIEACEKINENKKISLVIRYKCNNIFISIENTYNGKLGKAEGDNEQSALPKTTKGDFIHHGIGLQNVKNIVSKYNGDMSWSADSKIFRVDILIYQPEKRIKKDELLQKSN